MLEGFQFENEDKAMEYVDSGREMVTLKNFRFYPKGSKNITMILETDKKKEGTIAVVMSTETFDAFEITVKKFCDRYSKLWKAET